jgi:threonine/homoserine/homoserine lactone efflux protein
MLGIHDLGLFIVSGLVLNVTPGPDTAYIVGRSAQLGWRGGTVAALGISTGCLVHVLACAIGLSAVWQLLRQPSLSPNGQARPISVS